MIKKENEYNIISLGGNCLPRTVLTRYKLKPRKKQGELSCVFDLAIHFDTFKIVENIKNHFANYFDALEFSKEKNYWVNNDITAYYSHDADCDENNKQKLISRYQTRIDNFYEMLNSSKPTLFVHYTEDMNDGVNLLYDEIKNIRGDKPFAFVLISISANSVELNPNINSLEMFFPSEGYDWWVDYDSKEGKAFEKEIATFCASIIKEKLGCKVRKVKKFRQKFSLVLRKKTRTLRRKLKI